MSKSTGVQRQMLSLARVTTMPLPETFDHTREQTKPRRGQLRAVTPLNLPSQPVPVAVGSQGVVQENRREASSALPAETSKRREFSQLWVHLLTTEDFIQVKLATIRESRKHCYWPTDVLAKILAADVITPGNGQA